MNRSEATEEAATRWLQVFELRVPLADRGWVESILRDLARDTANNGTAAIRVYRHTEVVTDFTVHITCGASMTAEDRLSLGNQLTASLRSMGSLYTSTWQEINWGG